MPSLVDELPLVALAASCARGRTDGARRGGAARSRSRTASRRPARRSSLRRARRGHGGRLARSAASRRACAAAPCSSHGDHRIAMLGAVAGLYSESGVRVVDAGAIDVSFPGFRGLARARCARRRSDRDHRRAGGRRQVDRGEGARRAARLPPARHRRDVPRGDAGGAAHGRRPGRRSRAARPGAGTSDDPALRSAEVNDARLGRGLAARPCARRCTRRSARSWPAATPSPRGATSAPSCGPTPS